MDNRGARVEDVMTPDPMTIESSSSVRDAWATMRDRHFRHLPVVDNDRLVGIISITDIGRAGATVEHILAQPVSAFMTRDPLTIAPDARVEVAAATMASRKINCLLVIEGSAIAGIVTTYDLLDALAQRLRSE